MKLSKINPNHAGYYVNRGDLYKEVDDYNEAVKDYDNAVRCCPNYAADFIDRNFRFGGKGAVEKAIELLDSTYPWPPEGADAYYYTGVKVLFNNDGLSAQRCFEIALKLGYDDQTKIKQHLENLKEGK